MRYEIQLTIDYTYESGSDRGRNIVRLLPCFIPGVQHVEQARLIATPFPDEERHLIDFFGNSASHLVWHNPTPAVSFSIEAYVERLQGDSMHDMSPPLVSLHKELIASRSLHPESPHHFLGPSPRTGPMSAMTAFAKDAITTSHSTLEAIEAVGHALHREMKFDAEATTVETPPSEAFEKRHGVCQDFAHIMIAALRGVGIPAGYVSGFLRTFPPPGKPRLEGADAMHAWVRAWAGQTMGWIEFDPTNDQFAGTDYIKIGHGRDYSDVAPVLGAMRSAGGHDSVQTVDVIPLDH
ncbi:transglutaminase [Thioclava sp. SK-1]|uniref:transglutaminase family protein n=1 Tax=Thioclava sp. SK-1 TaxID=1889770 RepID=UPI000824713B|nr:transglutaminase family protein [Thioclava sp. SK-1]OCX67087.1 transglutaminase [Thioclava sp. SK-1]